MTTYLHQGHLGSAVSGTLQSGSVNWTERYTPFGEKLLDPMANRDQASFTGHIDDKLTGLTYMQARYYEPVIGRFLSVDPVTFLDSGENPDYFNSYAYTFNDPVNNTDPDGKVVETVLDVTSLVVGVASFADNAGKGNVGAATLDGVGIIVDAVAAVVPFVPGGAGLGIKAFRKSGEAVSNAKSASNSVGLQKQLASESQLSQLADGGGKVIRQPAKQADRIASQYGSKSSDIQKVSSDVFIAKDGQPLQTHAFRDASTNKIIEPKTIIKENK